MSPNRTKRREASMSNTNLNTMAYNDRTPSDLGYTVALQDAIDALRKAFTAADTEKRYHHSKIHDGVSIGDDYTYHRKRYEFYDGKCDALAEALKPLKIRLQSINEEYAA